MAFPSTGEWSSGYAYIVLSSADYMVDIAISGAGNILKVIGMWHYGTAFNILATSQPLECLISSIFLATLPQPLHTLAATIESAIVSKKYLLRRFLVNRALAFHSLRSVLNPHRAQVSEEHSAKAPLLLANGVTFALEPQKGQLRALVMSVILPVSSVSFISSFSFQLLEYLTRQNNKAYWKSKEKTENKKA